MSNHSINHFLEASGIGGPLRLAIESQGKQGVAQRALFQPYVLVGREPRSDLLLDHALVSRRHAYLQIIAGRVFCLDLQSRSGTHWEDGPKRSGWIDNGKAIRIGPYWLRPHAGDGADHQHENQEADSAAQFFGERELPEVTLEFANRAGRTSTWQMSPILALVGRSPDCRVHLVGQSVSNFHCSLVRTPMGLWIVDLIGRGGIRVNTVQMRSARLDDGDLVQVGRFQIRIHYDTAPAPRVLDEALPQFQSSGWSASQPQGWFSPFAAATGSGGGPQAPEVVVTPNSPPSFVPPTFATAATAPRGELIVVPSEPRTDANGSAAASMLMPLAQQLGAMQQQMFDQFQQAMMMMFQMFNTLQRDQVQVIRQELNHLQDLTKELRSLQGELLKRGYPPPQESLGTATGQAAGFGKTTANGPGSNLTPAKTRPEAPPKPVPTEPPIELPPPTRPPAAEAGQTEEEMHAWLAQRIASIQVEQQSTWQKVVGFLSGAKKDG